MSTRHPHDADHDVPMQESHVPQLVARLLRNPAVRALIIVLTAGLIFWLGTRIGQTVHHAFDGDTGAAIVFGAIVLLVPLALVALGALADRWLDARRGRSSSGTASGA